MNIFHISDLHIRSDNKHNFQVESKLHELGRHIGPADLIVITGDITDDGSEVQYAQALKILTPFTGRLIIVPGNHDYGPLGNFYEKACEKRFKTFKNLLEYPKREFNSLRILCVDSCLRTASPLDFARGKVGALARRAIKKFGIECKKKGFSSLVALHHTPFEEHWALGMIDKEEFLRVCEGYVDFVLVGHEHKKRVVSFNKDGQRVTTTYYSAPSLANESAQPICIEIPVKQ